MRPLDVYWYVPLWARRETRQTKEDGMYRLHAKVIQVAMANLLATGHPECCTSTLQQQVSLHLCQSSIQKSGPVMMSPLSLADHDKCPSQFLTCQTLLQISISLVLQLHLVPHKLVLAAPQGSNSA